MEEFAPYFFSALAVGGIVNTTRFWRKDRPKFWRLWLAIGLGGLIGFTVDGAGLEGLRTGIAVGTVALPMYETVTKRIRAKGPE